MNYYGLSDIGYRRLKNQDAYCILKDENDNILFVVCDGIGGNKAGEIAANKSIEEFSILFKQKKLFTSYDEAHEFLFTSLLSINKKIWDLGQDNKNWEGMGTTITGLLFTNVGSLSFNIGDSRCYGFDGRELIQLTQDDSLVGEMLRLGQIDYETSIIHPKRHYLTKALGIWPNLDLRINPLADYQQYLICSDGLHGYVRDKELATILKKKISLEEKALQLKQSALNKGGYDNITLILVDKLWQK